jgi:alpha-tubulin suppressor-like RCC1 family protein
VTYISAGAFFSLAVTKEGALWGWGEARMGQLGTGQKQRSVILPEKISFPNENGD